MAPGSRPLRFALAITCLDGRVQRPVVDYMRRTYGVDYVDLITEPGPERALTEPTRAAVQAAIHRNASFSVKGHDAELIAVAAHDDCLGNDADPETRLRQLRGAQHIITSWNLGVDVIGLWVHMDGTVEEAAAAIPAPPTTRPAPAAPTPPPTHPADDVDSQLISAVIAFALGVASEKNRSGTS
ncbi:MAG: carbonic anhydrase [Acidobacteriota bacterium]